MTGKAGRLGQTTLDAHFRRTLASTTKSEPSAPENNANNGHATKKRKLANGSSSTFASGSASRASSYIATSPDSLDFESGIDGDSDFQLEDSIDQSDASNDIYDDQQDSEDVQASASDIPTSNTSRFSKPSRPRPVTTQPVGPARPLPKEEYGYGLDETLQPITNIQEIFNDMTQKALSINSTSSQSRTPKSSSARAKKVPPTVIHHNLKDVVNHLRGKKLRIVTMCSGTESPILALGLIGDSLKSHGLALPFDHLFSAEIVPFKQAYIQRNFAPPLIFRDITEFDKFGDEEACEEATTAYGALADVPRDVDILITGFSCVDHSALNINKQKKAEAGNSVEPSESGDTLGAVLTYVNNHRPKMVILENVCQAPWTVIATRMSAMEYTPHHVLLDTKNYYIPHTRNRGYMFCVDSRLFATPEKAIAATNIFAALMKLFSRPASSSVQDFLLSPNDFRLNLALRELERGFGEATVRKAISWIKSQGRHSNVRGTLGLGTLRPITHWRESGTPQALDYMSQQWAKFQVNRVLDTVEINFLRTLCRGYDNRYKDRIIDLSQNVDRNNDTIKSGITGCITPSGIPFSTFRGGPITGLEALALQGLPIDQLQLNRETQANLQDLAGNAMTSTVVGAAILSALISAFSILERGADTDEVSAGNHQISPQDHDMDFEFAAFNEKSIDKDDNIQCYEPMSVLEACSLAQQTNRLCRCEDSSGCSLGLVKQCIDCGHTACTACGKHPRHNFEKYDTTNRQSPGQFVSRICGALPPRMSLDGMALCDFQKFSSSICKNSAFSPSQRTKALEVIKKAFLSELRLNSRPDRSEVWAFAYDSEFAQATLTISKKFVDWNFFAKSPVEEAVNSPIRKLFNQPLAQMRAEGCDLTKGFWKLRRPEILRISATLTGAPESLANSFHHRCGLEHYQNTKVHSRYELETASPISDHIGPVNISGSYRLLNDCDTACGSLHVQEVQTEEQQPYYMFLDPDLLGHPDDDCFVFSNDSRRMRSNLRSIVARLDSGWRPDRLKEVSDAEGNTILKKHDVWISGRSQTNRAWHEKLQDYESGSSQVTIIQDAIWTDVPAVRIVESKNIPTLIRPIADLPLCQNHVTCDSAQLVVQCLAKVPAGELTSWIGMKTIDKIGELAFFNSFSWLTESIRDLRELSTWNTVDSSLDACQSCSPQRPRILWKLLKDKFVPYEDPHQAARYEYAVKSRPASTLIQSIVTAFGNVSLKLSINPQTLMHRALQDLPASEREGLKTAWRLVVDAHGEALAKRPQFVLSSNECDSIAEQPPSFAKYPLHVTQLRSLGWMISQERSPRSFFEEETQEATIKGLGWRLEGRATRPVEVRGGVLADEVGFGKTATTLGLIDSQMADDKAFIEGYTTVDGRKAVHATLVAIPHHLVGQWRKEIDKFVSGAEKYRILVIRTIGDLSKATIEDVLKADIVLVSWDVLKSEAYLFKVAQFTGRIELPAKFSGRIGSAWYAQAVVDVVESLNILDSGTSDLAVHLRSRLNNEREAAADPERTTYVPSRRLRGAMYRKAKEATEGQPKNAQKRKRNETSGPKGDTWKDRGDDFKLGAIWRKKISWKSMPYPLFEMFEWCRVVVDEYTYANGPEDIVIRHLKARSRWSLSGTPPLKDFADVKSISNFMSIHLGIDDVAPGTTSISNMKRLTKEMTSFEQFHGFQQSHSSSWHENRHGVAQKFLDHFVRQNFVDKNLIPSTTHWMALNFPVIERCRYLELQNTIVAHDGDMVEAKETKGLLPLHDREVQIKRSFRPGKHSTPFKSPGECLQVAASHIDLGEYFLGNGMEDDSPTLLNLRSIVAHRYREYEASCLKLLDLATDAESYQLVLGETCEQYAIWTREIKELHYGDDVASLQILDLFRKACTKATASRFPPLNSKTTIRRLRETTKDLANVSIAMANRARSHRFLRNVDDLQNHIHPTCSACKRMDRPPKELIILVECGHMVCDMCIEKMHADLTKAEDRCPVDLCKADSVGIKDIRVSQFISQQPLTTIEPFQNSAKIDGVVSLVKLIPKNEQALLFVQYPCLVKAVGTAFSSNGISYASMDGTTADEVLNSFQGTVSEKKKKVLILNIGDASAAGGNLTNANHVIFLAPYMSQDAHSYEQAMTQAIGRARRQGQEKHVHIYRFVSLNTIDVDVVECREKMPLVEFAARGRGSEKKSVLPYKGFVESNFGLDETRKGERGSYRSAGGDIGVEEDVED